MASEQDAPPRTVGELIARADHLYPHREYVVTGEQRITYAALEERSRRLAAELLASGVGKGTRVGILMSEGPDWVVTWAALLRIGAVAVAVSTLAKAGELSDTVRHADLHGIIVGREATGVDLTARLADALVLREHATAALTTPTAPYLRWVGVVDADAPAPWLTRLSTQSPPPPASALVDAAAAEVHPDDVAMVVYSSGVTAKPKAAVHTHGAMAAKAFHLARFIGMDSTDRTCAVLPWFWVGGLAWALLPSLAVGATNVVLHRFTPEGLLATIERERVTRVLIFPHQIPMVLEHPALASVDLSSVTDGPPGIARGAPDAPTLRLMPSLGMTETLGMYGWGHVSTAMGWNIPIEVVEPGLELEARGPDGRPVADGEVGEIWLRGGTLMIGLHKTTRSEVFDTDGWFRTGDLVRREGDALFPAGRSNAMIKCRGASVSPEEVEALLTSHDAVASAHVVGLDDGDRGQRIAAAVVPVAGAAPTPEELRTWTAQRISTFKVPEVIVMVEEDDVPWTPSGKVRRPELAALIEERADDRGHRR